MFFSLRGKNEFDVDGKVVLITGGSQGMGFSVARILSKKGASVIIVARNVQKLQDAQKHIAAAAKDPSRQRFYHIPADVTSHAENVRIFDTATYCNDGDPPDIVWAVAGSAIPMLFLDASVQQLHSLMNVNFWSAAYMARCALRAWFYPQYNGEHARDSSSSRDGSRQQPRHFIMTASTAAFVGIAGYSPYSPGKAAIRSLHDNLQSELNVYHGALAARQHSAQDKQLRQVRIHTVFPGGISSPGHEEENKTKHPVTKLLEEDDEMQTGDEAAAAAIAELEKGRCLITTQRLQGAAMRASSLQGSPRDRWFVDTVFSWLMSVVWLFISWDLERKAWKWGYNNGMPPHKSQE
ncbi:MAG: 3-dehydrosphinganine reductase [Alyxoria varia]|nr:MAG: 3-dehydrosphinganine reductase [Alyxoria varia]